MATVNISKTVGIEELEGIRKVIIDILETGASTRMEQATIIEALTIIKKFTAVENITFSHNTIYGEKIERGGDEN